MVRTRRVLDTEGVETVMRAAEQVAREKGFRVVIAVVDAWGRLLQLRRTEGAQPASDQVAVDKARTAAIFVRPSREIEEQVSGGRLGALALHGAAALIGGVPLRVDGEVVGAIGTSGETPDKDESVSAAGAAAEFSTVEVPALTRQGAQRVAETVGAAAAGANGSRSGRDRQSERTWLLRRGDVRQFAVASVKTPQRRTTSAAPR
jgi:glc operon protein GlcG